MICCVQQQLGWTFLTSDWEGFRLNGFWGCLWEGCSSLRLWRHHGIRHEHHWFDRATFPKELSLVLFPAETTTWSTATGRKFSQPITARLLLRWVVCARSLVETEQSNNGNEKQRYNLNTDILYQNFYGGDLAELCPDYIVYVTTC